MLPDGMRMSGVGTKAGGPEHPLFYLFKAHKALVEIRLGMSAAASKTWLQIEVPADIPVESLKRKSLIVVAGELALLQGDAKTALDHFSRGIQTYESNEQPPDQWLALLHSGRSLAYHHAGQQSLAQHEAAYALRMLRNQIEDEIAIINPQTGQVTGWIDLTGINSENQNTSDVLNGIAYDQKRDRLFVTGKLWSQLFEIELVPAE